MHTCVWKDLYLFTMLLLQLLLLLCRRQWGCVTVPFHGECCDGHPWQVEETRCDPWTQSGTDQRYRCTAPRRPSWLFCWGVPPLAAAVHHSAASELDHSRDSATLSYSWRRVSGQQPSRTLHWQSLVVGRLTSVDLHNYWWPCAMYQVLEISIATMYCSLCLRKCWKYTILMSVMWHSSIDNNNNCYDT